MADRDRIPVLVVSGFLGSGKTTLLRRLLAEAQAVGERLGVVVNDFGSLGIDRALLGAGSTRSVELAGGCVCCELSDELVVVLEELRRSARPDRIVIETSGLALPYETQLSLWRPPVSEWSSDDMAVVLVNAEQLAEDRDLGELFEQQVSAADLLILNQVDRVPESLLPALEERLHGIEPDVPIVRAVQADVDPLLLRPADARPRSAPEERAHDHALHRHYAAETLEIEPGLTESALVARLRALGAVRAKGFVATAEGPRLVQGVGRRIECTPATPPDPALLGRLVVIRAVDGERG
ncbi:MAG: GTP-binding protein [Myxococcota bacterium]|jgi:cobalamin biosynthesis protein CobW|nr:GTP-binding protein [Myxococcota bacterium]